MLSQSVCTLCGKVLLDLDTSLHVIFPNKITNKSYRTKKRQRNVNNGIQTQKEQSLNGLTHNMLMCGRLLQDVTTQTSDNFEEA
ncbi:hypothetical protein CR513_35637, partial [Mucuna pruriens]